MQTLIIQFTAGIIIKVTVEGYFFFLKNEFLKAMTSCIAVIPDILVNKNGTLQAELAQKVYFLIWCFMLLWDQSHRVISAECDQEIMEILMLWIAYVNLH